MIYKGFEKSQSFNLLITCPWLTEFQLHAEEREFSSSEVPLCCENALISLLICFLLVTPTCPHLIRKQDAQLQGFWKNLYFPTFVVPHFLERLYNIKVI